MRVLHVIESLGTGGKERQLVELLKGLSAHHDIKSFVAVMSEDVHYRIDDEYAQIIPLVRESRRDPRVFKRLYQLALNLGIDVVHSWGSMCSVYAAPVVKLCGAAFVNGFVRDAPPHMTLKNKHYFRGRLTMPFSDVVVANSRAGLAAYRIPKHKGICIHNGFDFERIRNLTDQTELRSILGITTPHIVGMVASFIPEKDYATFVEMACRICHLRDDVTFVAVGDGDTLCRVRNSVSPSLSPRMEFLGRRRDVESVANLFTVGVLVSNSSLHGEGISNAITEYMALGKPVVATDDGGTPELVLEGKTGFLVPSHNPASLTDRVLKLLDNAELARAFGIKGRHRVEVNFSLEAMTNAYVSLYRQLANKKVRAT